jgi:outer membrane usher protein
MLKLIVKFLPKSCISMWVNPSVSWLLFAMSAVPAVADDYFDPAAIEQTGNNLSNIDLTVLEKTGGQLPGVYMVAVFINDNYITDMKINFRLENSRLIPDLTKEQLINWGVKAQATSSFMLLKPGLLTAPLSTYLPDSQTDFDAAKQRLAINVPQIYMQPSVRNNVTPKEWDNGINAGFINYSYSGASQKLSGEQGSSTTNYLNLRSGINFGPWRLRNYSTWSGSASGSSWNNINTYIQRAIIPLRAQFTAGDSNTPGEVFDAFAFRGITLQTSESMQPDILRGFAPVVRGIAKSNAQVTIQQNGNIIYQSYMPAGPFAITDLYPTAASGDLEVSIKEADGSLRKFIQPFASVPIMQREGHFKYSVTAGKYRDNAVEKSINPAPIFSQITGIYGLTSTTTIYGGSLLSRHYLAENIGLGKGLGNIGSVSFDATWAKAEFNQLQTAGASFRFQYSKSFTATGTNVTLAGYRYSTSGYLDFSEANGYQEAQTVNGVNSSDSEQAQIDLTNWRYRHNRRSRAQLTFNQNMGSFGGLNISGYQQQYWGVSEAETSVNLSYYLSLKNINYSLNYSLSESPYTRKLDKAISLAVQIPFDRFLPNSWLSISSSKTEHGTSTNNLSITGSALADNQLTYSLQEGMSSSDNAMNTAVSADYRGQTGEYSLGFNTSSGSQVLNYGAMGGILIHRYGITMSQPLGDTVALVRAANASGVRIVNNPGVTTDYRGFAVVPYLSAYQHNQIQLDTGSLDEHIDIDKDTLQVTPTQGAIVMANFPTHYGEKLMLLLKSPFAIPMGASASVQNGNHTSVGMVDDRFQVYLSGAPQKGVVDVSWKNGHCQANYDIGADKNYIHFISVQCK